MPQPLIQLFYDSQATWSGNILLLLNKAEARVSSAEWNEPQVPPICWLDGGKT